MPFLPVRLCGKKIMIREWALVDSGAKYCVLHPEIVDELDLPILRIEKSSGFGSSKDFDAKIVSLSIELEDLRKEIEVATIPLSKYPPKAPKVIIGRNFLKSLKLILDGIDQKICLM